LWLKADDALTFVANPIGNWNSKKSCVGTSINDYSTLWQSIYQCKDVFEFAFNVCSTSFDQSLGLKVTMPIYNKAAMYAV
jgi:hypothetical protein